MFPFLSTVNFVDTAGLDAAEVASLMAKQGMYTEAGNLLKAFKEPADVAVKILASSYACNISRPEAEGLEMQLIGNSAFSWSCY